jgi:hypothetical protein
MQRARLKLPVTPAGSSESGRGLAALQDALAPTKPILIPQGFGLRPVLCRFFICEQLLQFESAFGIRTTFADKKRQRTGAVQKLAPPSAPSNFAQCLGVRPVLWRF